MQHKDIAVGVLLAFHKPREPYYYPVAVIDVSTLWTDEVIAGERMYEPVAGWRCRPSHVDGGYGTGYLTAVPRDLQADGHQIADDMRAWLTTLPARLTEDAVNALARNMPPTLQISLESSRYFIDTWRAHRAAVDAGLFQAEVQRRRARQQIPAPSTLVQYVQRRAFSQEAVDLSGAVVEDGDSVTMPSALLGLLLGFRGHARASTTREAHGERFLDSAGVPIRIGDTVVQASAAGTRWSNEQLGGLQVNAGEVGTVVGMDRSRVRVDFGRAKVRFGRVETGESAVDEVHPNLLTVGGAEELGPVGEAGESVVGAVPPKLLTVQGAEEHGFPELSVLAARVLWQLRHNPGEYTAADLADLVSEARHLVRPAVYRLAEVGLAREAYPGRQVKRWVLDGSAEWVDAVLEHYGPGSVHSPQPQDAHRPWLWKHSNTM